MSDINDSSTKRVVRQKPAATVEDREKQVIASAYELAEKRIMDGTASSQIIMHFLKAGSTSERLAQDIQRSQKNVLDAKKESLESTKKTEELYANAMAAMKEYAMTKTGDEDE